MAHAIALLSGGLDSTLSVLLMRRQGIEVTAVTFLTHFGCGISDSSSCSSDSSSNARRFGFTVKLCHLGDKFIEVVKNPKYGHGRNMNPCIDCRILMLKEAKALMDMLGADFIVTGEVLGQRPMSQRKETLPLIDRQAGLEGYVLRPLSARLFKPTVPEASGIVDRERLYAMSGRSRKPQMALAREFGLTDYPAPAGGCLLTEPNYSHRLKELLNANPNPSLNDLHLLRLGRHFRLLSGPKLIVGRDKDENAGIEKLAEENDYLMKVEDFGSPISLLRGYPPLQKGAMPPEVLTASAICARYSDAGGKDPSSTGVEVTVKCRGDAFRVKVKPAGTDEIESLRIEKKGKLVKAL